MFCTETGVHFLLDVVKDLIADMLRTLSTCRVFAHICCFNKRNSRCLLWCSRHKNCVTQFLQTSLLIALSLSVHTLVISMQHGRHKQQEKEHAATMQTKCRCVHLFHDGGALGIAVALPCWGCPVYSCSFPLWPRNWASLLFWIMWNAVGIVWYEVLGKHELLSWYCKTYDLRDYRKRHHSHI